MQGERERGPVHRQQQLAAEVDVGVDRLLRVHVDVGPGRAVRADRHQRQVERAVLGADAGVAVEVTGVSGVEDPAPSARDRPGSPQCVVAGQGASREVPGRGRGEPQARDLRLLFPVELDDALARHSPLLQVRADAQRHEERRRLDAGERAHRRQVEMVVVVVRDHDRVHLGQRAEAGRDRVQPLGPDELRRRDPLAPHRIEQHAASLDLDQRRRVTEPHDAQPVR